MLLDFLLASFSFEFTLFEICMRLQDELTCPPSNVPISFQVCRCSHVTDLPPLSSLAASAASKRNFCSQMQALARK